MIRENNVWWGGSNWNNGAVWRFTIFGEKTNDLDIWGSEGCCDGA